MHMNDYSEIFLKEDGISFYLLGVIMSDGCVSKTSNNIQIKSKDIKWISEIGKAIKNKSNIFLYKNCGVLSFNSYRIKEWLMSYGCVPAKSLCLKINKEIPQKYLPFFLNGIIDGDGWITKQYVKHNGKFSGKLFFINC